MEWSLVLLCGEIRTEIANIKDMITELKNDHKEVDVKIKEAIQQHEDNFHKNKEV